MSNERNEKPIVFFDTNIVGENGFPKLKKLAEKGKVKLKTSRKVLNEIDDLQNKKKKEKLKNRIESIDTVPDLFSFRGGGASFSMKPLSEEDKERFSRVLEIVFGMSLEQFGNDMHRKSNTTERIERDA